MGNGDNLGRAVYFWGVAHHRAAMDPCKDCDIFVLVTLLVKILNIKAG